MPELPEVEYAASIARRVAEGRVITSVMVLHPSQRRNLSTRVARSLIGDRVEGIERRGKTQFFRLTSGRVLAVHFRMTGDWTVLGPGDPLPPFARAVLGFDHGARLALDDSRALSVLSLCGPDAIGHGVGPEPHDPAFDAAWLGSALARRRGPIKPALLDQRLVAGLGNIYAAEALWHARIDPRAAARRVGPVRRGRLVRAIRHAIAKAMGNVARYYRSDGSTAQARFAVYDREGQKCKRCGGTIRRVVQAGRSTYFCAKCQR